MNTRRHQLSFTAILTFESSKVVCVNHVNTWGDPELPNLVLLPGAGGSRWLWTPHAELLADEYRVISIDMPAHGTHPDSSFDIERATQDVGVILEEEGPAVLVGHSLGGHVAMNAASAYAEQIDAVLVAGVGAPPGTVSKIQQLALSYVVEIAAHSTYIREWMDDQYGLDDERQLPPENLDTHDEAIATARGMRGALFQKSVSRLKEYDGPIAFAYGDKETETEAANELAERVGAEVCWYEGGHGTPSRNPERFVEIVETFLTMVDGSGTRHS